VTGGQGVWFENSNDVDAGATLAATRSDTRLLPIWTQDNALATNGMGQVVSFEMLWWKILLPQVRLHAVSVTTGVLDAVVLLSYRFAELTDDEIVEVAAQRAQQ